MNNLLAINNGLIQIETIFADQEKCKKRFEFLKIYLNHCKHPNASKKVKSH